VEAPVPVGGAPLATGVLAVATAALPPGGVLPTAGVVPAGDTAVAVGVPTAGASGGCGGGLVLG
jgi:hypothetical protein